MGVIRKKFEKLKQNKTKAFIPYLTYGFPNSQVFEQTLLVLEEVGCDIIEVGMPFSDPVADGPVIQYSSQVALEKGATLPGLLMDLKRLRSKLKTPIAVMTYFNPVFFMGVDIFCRKAKNIIDAVIVPDLIPEEASNFIRAARANKIDTVFFIAPTTDPKRIKLIDKSSSGFIYYVSVTGTTGQRQNFDKEIFKKIAAVKAQVKSPLCVGFGISNPTQVKKFQAVSDGVIVGSAIIKFIQDNYKQSNFLNKFKKFIQQLKG